MDHLVIPMDSGVLSAVRSEALRMVAKCIVDSQAGYNY